MSTCDNTSLCTTCGAECIPSGCTTGYGVDSEGKRHCFKCCAVRDEQAMRETGKLVGYLTKDKITGNWLVGNWPGSLFFRVVSQSKSRHNFGCERMDVWFYGPDGFRWHGVHIGDNNQIVRCRRTRAALRLRAPLWHDTSR